MAVIGGTSKFPSARIPVLQEKCRESLPHLISVQKIGEKSFKISVLPDKPLNIKNRAFSSVSGRTDSQI